MSVKTHYSVTPRSRQLALLLALSLSYSTLNTLAYAQGVLPVGAIQNSAEQTSNPITAPSTSLRQVPVDIMNKPTDISTAETTNPLTNSLNNFRDDPLYFDWQASSSSVCRGYYRAPPFTSTESALTFDESPTTLTYSGGELLSSGTSTLHGNVLIEQPQFRLYADTITFNRDEKTGEITSSQATGHVLLEQPTLRLTSDTANINFLDKSGTLTNSYYRFYESHSRGNAELIKRLPNGKIKLFSTSYTVCPPFDNTWHLNAKEVTLDREKGRGVAYGAKLYLKDIPVLYTPYLSFPINKDRKTGFLTPNYERSSLRGEELIFPFYVNLAPNYDVTLTTRTMSMRGVQEESDFRYLTPYGQGNIYAAITPKDEAWRSFRENNIENNPRDLPPDDIRLINLENTPDLRTAFSFQNTSVINRYTLLNANYSYVSDDNYLVDFTVPNLDNNVRQLERQLNVNMETPIWSVGSRLLSYQVLQPYDATISAAPYYLLPQVMAMADAPSSLFGLDYTLYSEIAYFDQTTSSFTRLPLTIGSRIDVAPAFDIPLRTSAAYFVPRAELRITHYDLILGPGDEAIGKANAATRTIPLFDIDAGLLFDRNFALFHRNYTQTLEPRLFYLYVPYKNQNRLPVFDSSAQDFQYVELFYTNRFNGRDRVGDANQLTYSVITRFDEQETGIERARISLGQTLYFRDRLVTLCDTDAFPSCLAQENPNWNEPISPLVGELHYAFTDIWYGSAETQWNMHEAGRLDQGGIWLTYHGDNDHILDLGYRYIWQGNPVGEPVGSSANNLEQILGSFSYRLTPRWHVLAGAQYDVINRYTIDSFGGIEYENCCWAARVGARHELTVNSSSQEGHEFDNVIYMQFIFKGLATLGTDPSSMFVERIQGYRDYFGKRF